jgi:peptide deformylase
VAVLPIVQAGDPVLRERAREVQPEEIGTPALQQLCVDLVETMREAHGAGLAAPQLGDSLRLFAVEVSDNERYPYKPELGLRVLVNPVVRALTDESYMSYEGCLSVPDVRGLLPRHTEVEVVYLDQDGVEHVERFGGLSAGTMQHELDHLDGVLFLDRVEDPATLCSWELFARERQDAWVESIRPLLERFPGESR